MDLFNFSIDIDMVRVQLADGNTLFIKARYNYISEFFQNYYATMIQDQYQAKDRIKKGSIVFDCGAHIGTFSLLACNLGADCVYAIEPVTWNIAALERLIIQKKPINIIPGVALEKTFITSFTIGDTQSSGQGYVSEDGDVDVAAFSIDDIVETFNIPHVDFIKADVEGSELRLLQGAQNTIRKFKPHIAMSAYHHEDDALVLPKYLLSIRDDYDINIIRKNVWTEVVLIAS